MFTSNLLVVLLATLALSFAQNDSSSVDNQRSGRILGGVAIRINDAPYTVAITVIDPATQLPVLIGGGAIISTTHILTSARVVFGRLPGALTVVAGASDYTIPAVIDMIAVARIQNHPRYMNGNLNYDISILFLSQALLLDGATKTSIGLPRYGNPLAAGSQVYVSGWGFTTSANAPPLQLQGFTTTIINKAVCARSFRPNQRINSQMVCAFTAGRAFCTGDIGGPVTLGGQLVGIASFSKTNCDGTSPEVYTKVSFFRNWIRTTANV